MLKKSKQISVSILFFVIFFVAIICSCNKTRNVQYGISVDGESTGSVSVSSWHPSQKKICIVFGYGYNDKMYVQNIVDFLVEKYGRDDGSPDSGLIFPLVFPDDFPGERVTRISSLIDERELEGLIIVGAPENTNQAIAMLEDEWDAKEKMIPYPIYAFFPQDDVAGIEATANFVLDRALEGSGSEDNETDKEEVSQTQIKDLDKLLDRAIEYMLLTGEPLPSDSDLIVHVSRIVGKDYTISRYVDAESGLQSINHFVIEEVRK